jgi:hypothetical protein
VLCGVCGFSTELVSKVLVYKYCKGDQFVVSISCSLTRRHHANFLSSI